MSTPLKGTSEDRLLIIESIRLLLDIMEDSEYDEKLKEELEELLERL